MRHLFFLIVFIGSFVHAAGRPYATAYHGPPLTQAVADEALRLGFSLTELPQGGFTETIKALDEESILLADITPAPNSPNVPADTAFLIGYALAKHKPTLLFTRARDKYLERVTAAYAELGHLEHVRETLGHQRLMDPDGHAFEEFNLHENLMIDGAAHQSFAGVGRDALEALRDNEMLFSVRSFRRPQPIAGARGARPRIYLAGPDVFLPDPMAAADLKKKIAAHFEFDATFPLDNAFEFELPVEKFALKIFYANLQLMADADLIVANMTPFRGRDMDQGTAFEMGYMFAQGKKVLGYSADEFPVGSYAREAVLRSGGIVAHSFAESLAYERGLPTPPEFRPAELRIALCGNLLARAK